VILRVISGRIPPGMLDAVRGAYRRDYGPIARRTDGLARFVIGAAAADDGGHRMAGMTIWTSVEAALGAYGGDLSAPRTLDGQTHGETVDRVDYYELEAVRTLPFDGAPTRLRLTAGTVARGLGAEIQQDLRAHLPDLPSEALEAYVGRRVLGPSVEIAFMSTWTSDPARFRLDAPLWPEISERYDTFRMEVHEILLAGSGPAGSEDPPRG